MRKLLTRQRLIAQIPYLTVGLIVALGLVLVIFEYWRRGLVTIGGAAGVAAGLRLFVPARYVGLLSVRGRGFDVAAYLVMGIGLIGIGLAIPPPAG